MVPDSAVDQDELGPQSPRSPEHQQTQRLVLCCIQEAFALTLPETYGSEEDSELTLV